MRRVTVRGLGDARRAASQRIGELMAFLDGQPRWRGARIAYLQGDASTRSYARLVGADGTALLMDAPRQPDGPPIRDGKPYSRIAHLAEDMVRPFVAIGARAARRRVERARGPGRATSTRGCCWSRTSAIASSAPRWRRGAAAGASCGGPRSTRWSRCAACRCRAACRCPTAPATRCPAATAAAFEIEVELLLDWYWPALKGAPAPHERARRVPGAVGAGARPPAGAARRLVPARLPLAQPDLAAGARRASPASASSTSRMRSTSTRRLRSRLAAAGCARRRAGGAGERSCSPTTAPRSTAREPAFDARAFAAAYADFGAQRNTRLLGLLVRLLKRDGKPQYLQHHAAHLGISRAQPARTRAWRRWRRGTIGTSRQTCARRRCRAEDGRTGGRGDGRARSTRRWCCAPASARAWRRPTTGCPSRWCALQRQGADRSRARPPGRRRASSAPSSTCTTRPT